MSLEDQWKFNSWKNKIDKGTRRVNGLESVREYVVCAARVVGNEAQELRKDLGIKGLSYKMKELGIYLVLGNTVEQRHGRHNWDF